MTNVDESFQSEKLELVREGFERAERDYWQLMDRLLDHLYATVHKKK